MNSWSFAIILGTVYFDLVIVYLLAIPSTVPLFIRELEANITLCSLKGKVHEFTPGVCVWGGK
jgi:hypothetical protein